MRFFWTARSDSSPCFIEQKFHPLWLESSHSMFIFAAQLFLTGKSVRKSANWSTRSRSSHLWFLFQFCYLLVGIRMNSIHSNLAILIQIFQFEGGESSRIWLDAANQMSRLLILWRVIVSDLQLTILRSPENSGSFIEPEFWNKSFQSILLNSFKLGPTSTGRMKVTTGDSLVTINWIG